MFNKKLAPPPSSRKPRQPYTIDTLKTIGSSLDLSEPLDAAVWACLLSLFWGCTRTGAVKSLSSFDPEIHVKRCDVSKVTDRNGLP
ncbi:hypothetical protein PM082_007617 [Marasmius tenuissimus]|nr:hypothetical protein PM082_007617 [Marasmius tenuissimus]